MLGLGVGLAGPWGGGSAVLQELPAQRGRRTKAQEQIQVEGKSRRCRGVRQGEGVGQEPLAGVSLTSGVSPMLGAEGQQEPVPHTSASSGCGAGPSCRDSEAESMWPERS